MRCEHVYCGAHNEDSVGYIRSGGAHSVSTVIYFPPLCASVDSFVDGLLLRFLSEPEMDVTGKEV